MEVKTGTVVIYARAPFSQRYKPEDNLGSQVRRCVVKARESALQVADVFTDIGVASDLYLRPGFQGILISGGVKTIIVDAPDILARTVEMRADILYELATRGIEVIFVDSQGMEETEALLAGIRKRAETDE